ncbi:MAG: hypothetical protein ABIR03_14835 [Ginsengibacter sp.]
MKNLFTILLCGLIFFMASCNSDEKIVSTANSADTTVSIFPVTDFLKGQLRELDSMPVTVLRTITVNGKTDSSWLKRESIRPFALPFLTPVIDSTSMSSFFSAKSFLDQTINAFTLIYDANTHLPDSVSLHHWSVYIDPQTSKVQRIYLVKEYEKDGAAITKQLTWKVNEWCSIRTITEKPGSSADIHEEKMRWDFNN